MLERVRVVECASFCCSIGSVPMCSIRKCGPVPASPVGLISKSWNESIMGARGRGTDTAHATVCGARYLPQLSAMRHLTPARNSSVTMRL